MILLNVLLQAGGSANPLISYILPILIIVIIVIIVAVKSSKSYNDVPTSENQTNKIVNVTLTGGIIGLFSDSPQNSLNNIIAKENAKGWKVIQIIPANSGNLFLAIFRLLILLFTLFLYTTTNGYYLVMERKQNAVIKNI